MAGFQVIADSGEGERRFRRERERHSEPKANAVGAKRRWRIDCAGSRSASSMEMSGAQRRRRACSGERGVGKGAAALVPTSARSNTGRALARQLSAALFAHGIAAHLDAVRVMNESVENTVGSSGIADLFMPASHRKLGS